MRSFAAGAATGAAGTLGIVALLNARVLLFAAGFDRMRRENPGMFDGGVAAASVQSCLDEYGRETGL